MFRFFEIFIAWRYFASARRRVIALVSWMSLAGIAIGVAALTLSVAALDGFQQNIKGKLLEDSAHLRVALRQGHGGGDLGAARRALAATPGVRSIEAVVEARAWLVSERNGAGQATLVRGVDAPPLGPLGIQSDDAAGRSDGTGRAAERAAAPLPELHLEDSIAIRMGVGPGDVVTLFSPRTRLSPIGPLPVLKRFRIGSVVPAGAAGEGDRSFAPRRLAAQLFGIGLGANLLEAELKDPGEAQKSAAALRQRLDPSGLGVYEITTWEEVNRALYVTLRLEKLVVFAAISLIILVATLNLITNLAMTVVEKHAEIGVFLALGVTPAGVGRIFAALGLMIGAAGTALGLGLGAGGSAALEHWKLIPLPADVYSLDHIPFSLAPGDAVAVVAVSLLFAFLASVYPARRAALLSPGEALRSD